MVPPTGLSLAWSAEMVRQNLPECKRMLWQLSTCSLTHLSARFTASATVVCNRLILMALICIPFAAGCASLPYQAGSSDRYFSSPELAARTGPQIERGRPHKVLDTFGWVWGIPQKVILFDRRVENHNIDEHTESEMAAYLHDNQLSTVKVRLNQYHPGDDWHRLAANKSVGAGWRFTIGALSVLGETILPGRLFGGDHYNPFTNTIHLYSNVPAIAYHEGGHAKDFAGREWKGTYAAAYGLPVVPLYHEAVATNDAISYVRTHRDIPAQQEAYNILYPAYGTYVGNAIPGVPYGYLAGVLAGHAAGRAQSWQISRGASPESEQNPHTYERQPVSRVGR